MGRHLRHRRRRLLPKAAAGSAPPDRWGAALRRTCSIAWNVEAWAWRRQGAPPLLECEFARNHEPTVIDFAEMALRGVVITQVESRLFEERLADPRVERRVIDARLSSAMADV